LLAWIAASHAAQLSVLIKIFHQAPLLLQLLVVVEAAAARLGRRLLE